MQIQTVILDVYAPTSHKYEIELPAGSSTRIESDGSVSFIDSDGVWLGGVAVLPHGTSILGTTGQAIRNTSLTSAIRKP